MDTIFSERDDDGDYMVVFPSSRPSRLVVRNTDSSDGESAGVRLTRVSVERLRDALNEWLGDTIEYSGPEPTVTTDPTAHQARDLAIRETALTLAVKRCEGVATSTVATSTQVVTDAATIFEIYLRGGDSTESTPEEETAKCPSCGDRAPSGGLTYHAWLQHGERA